MIDEIQSRKVVAETLKAGGESERRRMNEISCDFRGEEGEILNVLV